jgi:hypothetical protein
VGFGASLEFKMEILKVVNLLLALVKDLRKCETKPFPLSLWQHTETSSEFTCCYQPESRFDTIALEYFGNGAVELYLQTMQFGVKGVVKTITKWSKRLSKEDVTVESRVERDGFLNPDSSPLDLHQLYLTFRVRGVKVLILCFTGPEAKINYLVSQLY